MSLPGCLLTHARAALHHLASPADAGRIVRWSPRRDTASPHHTLETGRQLFPSSRATMYRPVRSSKVSTRARTPLYSGLESRPCTSTRVLAGSTVGRVAGGPGAPCVVTARRGSSTAHTQGGHTCLCTGFTSRWIAQPRHTSLGACVTGPGCSDWQVCLGALLREPCVSHRPACGACHTPRNALSVTTGTVPDSSHLVLQT